MHPTPIGGSAIRHARLTGVVGLLMLASGSFTGFVNSKLVVRGDVVATARNIVHSEILFRLGLLSSLVMMIAFLLYALLLYKLLRPVNSGQARAMIAFVLASVPIYMLNQTNQLGALSSAGGQRYELVTLFLELHRLGNVIAGIFFGLWLFPLGQLVFKSGFFPKLLGVILMFGSAGYLALFLQAFLFPGAEDTLWTNPLLIVTHLSELALLLWLLIRGLNVVEWNRQSIEFA